MLQDEPCKAHYRASIVCFNDHFMTLQLYFPILLPFLPSPFSFPALQWMMAEVNWSGH
jgi:hypothetical protein